MFFIFVFVFGQLDKMERFISQVLQCLWYRIVIKRDAT